MELVYTHLPHTIYIDGLVFDKCILDTLPKSSLLPKKTQSARLPLRTLGVEMDDSPQLPIISSSSLPYFKHLRLRSSFAAAEALLRPTLKRLDSVITSPFPATQTWLGLLRDLPLLEELCLYGATPPQDPPVTCPFAQRTNMKHMRKLQLTTYAGSASCHELLESLTLPSSKWVSTCWEWPPDDMDVPSYLSTFRRLLQYIGDTIVMEVGDSETLDACYTFRTADPRSDPSVTVMLLAITSIKYLDRILMHSITPKLTHFTVVASGFTLPLWLATRHHPDIVEVSIKGQPAIESFVQASSKEVLLRRRGERAEENPQIVNLSSRVYGNWSSIRAYEQSRRLMARRSGK